MQTLEATEEPSCSSNGDTGDDPCSQHFRSIRVFETPCVSENYLDSEDSAYGNVLVSNFEKTKSCIMYTFYSAQIMHFSVETVIMPIHNFPVIR